MSDLRYRCREAWLSRPHFWGRRREGGPTGTVSSSENIQNPPLPEFPPDTDYFATDHLLHDLPGRSLRGGAVTLVGQAIQFVLQLGSTMTLARLLIPKDFGLIAMVTAITGFVAMFKDAGLSDATIQRSEITHQQISTLFWVNCGLSAAAMIIVALLAPGIAWFYHEPRLTWLTVALSSSFLLSGLGVQHRALLRRQMRFKTLAMIDCVSFGCAIALGIGMALLGLAYWSLVGLNISATLFNILLTWACCGWRPGKLTRKVGARSMLAFGGSITGFNVLNYFTRNFDNILVGRVLGSEAIGIYSKAYGLLALPMSQINFPIGGVVVPALSRLQDKPEEYRKLFLLALGAVGFVTIPLVVFSFFLAQDVVLVLLGPKWLRVATVFQFLGPAALVGAINIAPGWLCISLGTTRKQLYYGLISAPICVIAFLIGVLWELEGVAVAFSVAFSILFSFFVWYASKDSPVTWAEIAATFFSALAPACLAGGIAWSLRHGPISHSNALFALSISAMGFAAVYLASAMSFRQNRIIVCQLYSRCIQPYLRQAARTRS